MGCWGVWLFCFLLAWLFFFLLEKSKKDNGSRVFSSPLACSSSWGCLGALWARPLVCSSGGGTRESSLRLGQALVIGLSDTPDPFLFLLPLKK